MPSVDIFLELSAQACLAHYRGAAQVVHARSVDGRRVAFPARALRHIVTRDGVHGRYRLFFTPEGRFQSLVPLPG
ncbi:DUF2835 domain-containing protein [Modicisalibacter sp. 'Wilcox']|uniref:DUF2835 domain-containing protein n=1 Tax=Modicisalibacter sp. 'Wilcox' TaxID=2679914 RepID=UPI0013D6496E|nr:DUF2835 domain-containing protein [Modicisalibacter sp. 'Wilcox']